MQIQIKHRFSDKILFEGEFESLSKAVESIFKKRVSLQGADLQGADLRGADLQDADLQDADLRNAVLQGTDLQGVKNIDLCIARTRILPEGDIIGYKKCMNNTIVKLKIPASAKRSHAFGRKCRAEFAEVLEVFGAETAVSYFDCKTIYKAGEIVRPDKWSDDWRNECCSGIHFFITKIEAENY